MKRIIPLVIALAATVAQADVYVSPNGDDSNSGSPEKPLATLKKAIEQTRRSQQTKRILLRSGRYFDSSISLTPDDSALTIAPAPGEKPILIGGVSLKGWEKDGERFYAARLPAGCTWDIRLLQVNGRMCPRARYPEKGTLTHLSSFNVPWMSTTGGGWKRKPTHEELTTLKYKADDIGPWLDAKSAEITIYHMWDESVVGVARNDLAQHTLTLSPESGHPPGAFGNRNYVIWNIREGLTQPGQWYFDRANARIVYWPLPGEDMATADAIVPTQTAIIRVGGEKSAPVRDVKIRGLTFAVTTAPLITGGFAASNFDGCITLTNARNCILQDLTVAAVAGYGIVARRSDGTRIENCEIGPCGAGGISARGANVVLRNNLIAGVGRSYPSGCGILGGGEKNLVSHNEVHDCTYSAICYGGTGTIIEANVIYDCMKVLHDGAAIYVFGAKQLTIRKNFAHDISPDGGYPVSAYYLDEQCEGCTVEENLAVNVGWPSHNHMARNNTIRNNVFIAKGDAKITFPRCTGYTVEGNVLYAGGKIRIEGIDAVKTWSKNLFFSREGKIEGVILDQYSPRQTVDGIRGDTVAADPQFMDLSKSDYRYRPGSPAAKLGLKPIDVSTAGRQR